MGLQIAGNAIKITCVEEVLENVFQLQSLLLSFVAACWWQLRMKFLAFLHFRQYYTNPPLNTAKMIKKCRRHVASFFA